jgi:hypothetical protein
MIGVRGGTLGDNSSAMRSIGSSVHNYDTAAPHFPWTLDPGEFQITLKSKGFERC